MKRKQRRNKLIIVIIALAIMIGVTIAFLPLMIPMLGNDDAAAQARLNFQTKVEELGILGWLGMLALQIIQVVIAIIPGEPFEWIAGSMYGWFGGLMLSMLGVTIGTMLIWVLVKKIGLPFLETFVSAKDMERLGYVVDNPHPYGLYFNLFFIPGTPKDIITFMAPLSKNVSLWKFILVTSIARIPSIITSTYAGAQLATGHLGNVLAMALLIALIGIYGVVRNVLLFVIQNNYKKIIKISE